MGFNTQVSKHRLWENKTLLLRTKPAFYSTNGNKKQKNEEVNEK